MSKPKENYGQNNEVGVGEHSYMLGTEGSVHKWKENLDHVDRDFRQLEKQSESDCHRCHSSEVCGACTDFGISTSVYMV